MTDKAVNFETEIDPFFFKEKLTNCVVEDKVGTYTFKQ